VDLGRVSAPCAIWRVISIDIDTEYSLVARVRHYLSPDIKVRRGDVLSAWSGIRPLVRDPAAKNTQSLVRNHMINTSESGLLTIAGGKWTT
jgi:glycerol-3-phosphate dehydrogenase